jgi:Domain of unknown function (DUF5666)
MSKRGRFAFKSVNILSVYIFFFLAALFVTGCGGGGSTVTPPPPPPPPSTTSAQLRIGDAAVDKIVDFELTIASPIVATPSGGGTPVNIVVGPNRLELSHMAGKLEALGVLNVPQGSYSSIALTIQNPELVFVSGIGTLVSISGSASQTITVNFTPALTISSAPTLLNVDLNVANSIATDASGNITGFNFSNSSFIITTSAIGAEAQQEDKNGEIEGVTGVVSTISGNNFVLNVGQSGAQLTFATDNTTQFSDGLTNLASALNQIVEVDGVTKSDGTLFAKKLEGLEAPTGAEVEGLITLVVGNPATSLTVLAQDGIGGGMDNSKVGANFFINVNGLSSSKYKIDLGKCDTSGLTVPGPNFPFDPTTIHAGQRIEVETVNAVPAGGGTITAEKVFLEQQAISGTVSNFVAGSGGAATFDVNLPAESHLAVLSGQSVVHVFQQAGTNNQFGTISNSSNVRVRGLLFWTGTTFNMLARRITAP